VSQDLKTIALERMYCIRIGDHTTAIVEAEARELFDLLRAEFEPVPFRIPIRPTDEGLDRLAADLGLTPVTAPVTETPLLRHEGMEFPEPGPTLNDDIDTMIAGQSPGAVIEDWCPNCKNERCAGLGCKDITDDADEQEEEFLSRLPKPVETEPKEDPKPADGAYTGIESVAKDVVSSSGTSSQTWQDRLLELWAKYADKSIPDRLKFLYSSTRNSRHPELRDMDTAGIRQALRSLSIDVPEPMTPQERAAMARAKRLAAAGERLEPPKVEEPKAEQIEEVFAPPMPLDGVVPEATVQLIHALTRSVRRRWPDDKASIKAHIADLGPLTQLSRVTDDQIAQFDARYQGWLDVYSAMPPFKQREIDASLLTEWKRVAA